MEYLIIKVEEHRVTAARFAVSGRSVALAGAASFACDADNSLFAIAQRIAEGITESLRVVVCLSPALFAQRIIELPLTDLRKVREVLPAHLQGEMVQAPDDVIFDVQPLADGRFLAVWAKKSEISHAIETFTSAGIDPQIITADPFSWNKVPGVGADVLVCDGNALALITDGRLTFMRALEAGDQPAQLAAILSALQLSGSQLPAEMLVFGEHAEPLVAAEHLPVRVSLLALPTDAAEVFRTDAAFQQLAGLYAVLRSCQTGTLLDFRRGELAWSAGDARQRKKLLMTAILASCVLLLLLISKGLQYRAARADLASLNASISSLYRDIFPARAKAVDEIAEVKGEIRKLTGSDSSRGVLDVLKVLAEAKGVTINGLYEVELDGRTLRLKGDAQSAQAVNDFKAALAPLMSAVELGEVKSRPEGTVSFTMTGTIKEAVK